MKKFLIWLLVLISLSALLLRYSSKITEIVFGIKEKSGISILSLPSGAEVFLDGKEAGKTPFEDKNLQVRNYSVKIKKDNTGWEGKVRLNGGTLTVVNRDLATDSASSAGETLSLLKGKGLTIVSNPSGAEIEVDGKAMGRTPATLDIENGEHTILLDRANYLKRSIRADVPPDYNLTIALDLALLEPDLNIVSEPSPAVAKTVEVVVKNTPVGFLRVREKPGLNSREIARVKPGDRLVLLEEKGAWNKVRLSDNTEGYVSSGYTAKQP